MPMSFDDAAKWIGLREAAVPGMTSEQVEAWCVKADANEDEDFCGGEDCTDCGLYTGDNVQDCWVALATLCLEGNWNHMQARELCTTVLEFTAFGE